MGQLSASEAPPLIHIGFYKTATSWMQKYLFTEQFGFTVAMIPAEVQITLIEPGPFRFAPQQALGFYQKRVARSDPQATRLISVEALSGDLPSTGRNARQNADRLRATFPQAKILLVTREQKSLLRSLYKSMVAWGSTFSISRLLEPVAYPQPHEFNFDFLRFDLLAGYYIRLFGKENVLVLPYEMLQRSPREFLRRIIAHAGRDMQTAPEGERYPPFGKRVNKTVSLSAIAYQRWLNRLALAANGAPVSRFGNDEMVKRINRRMRHFPSIPYLDAHLERRFAATVAEGTMGKFTESNKRLQSMMGLNLAQYGYDMPGSGTNDQVQRPDNKPT